jgi:hypothetical protein
VAHPGEADDRHPHGRDAAAFDQALERLPGDATGDIERHRLAAELADHPRHVQATATRVVTLVARAHLAHRHDLVRHARGVDR